MQQYIDLCEKIYNEGSFVKDHRTQAITKVIISERLRFDCSLNQFHPVTVRRSARKLPIAEFLGYIKGFDNAKQFRELGAPTWDANANKTPSWLANPLRKGTDDLGKIYGNIAKTWPVTNEHGEKVGEMDLYKRVYDDLVKGIDNRREIMTYWNPGDHHNGALAPCLHSFQFSIVNGKLYLDAYQRSADVLIGTVANIDQVQFFLILMAHLTGLRPAYVTLSMVNCHFYANQIPLYEAQQRGREAIPMDMTMTISDEIKTWDDVVNKMTPEHVIFGGEYKHHAPIKYPFQE